MSVFLDGSVPVLPEQRDTLAKPLDCTAHSGYAFIGGGECVCVLKNSPSSLRNGHMGRRKCLFPSPELRKCEAERKSVRAWMCDTVSERECEREQSDNVCSRERGGVWEQGHATGVGKE